MQLLIFLLFASVVRAELDLKPHPRSGGQEASSDPVVNQLSMGADVFTKETIVDIAGRKFRRIEIKGEVFYLHLLRAEESPEELMLQCGEQGAMIFNNNMPAQIVAATKVTRRTYVFIEGLRQACVELKQGRKIELRRDLLVGFHFDDDPKSRALVKNKRVYIDPFNLTHLGFSGEW